MNAPEGQAPDRSGCEGGTGSRRGGSKITVRAERGMSRCGKCVGWIVLAAYLLLLVYLGLRHGEGGGIAGVAVWELQDSHRLLSWVGRFVFIGFCEFAYFVPVGFIAAMVVRRGSGRLGRFPISLRGLAAGSWFTVLVCAVEIGRSWHWAAAVGLMLPLFGCLFGTWIGTTWLRGRRARIWLLPKVGLLVLLIALCTGILLWLSMEDMPMGFEAVEVTSADKRRLVSLIRGKSPRSLEEGRTHTLRLTEDDINVLLSWGLSLGSPDRKAQISLARDYASMSVSVGVKLGGGRTRYLNFEAAGTTRIDEGIMRLNLYRCRLGSVQVPRWVLDLLCPVAASLAEHDRLSRPFVEAIESMAIETDSIVATYGRVDLPAGFREDLFGPASASEEVLASTRAQVDNLLAFVDRLPGRRATFGMCFESVFGLARARSAEGDPVTENRAGIFALGMLLGHHRVEEFLGSVLEGRENPAAQWALWRVTLRGRSDWTKHFCVSAAIAIFSDKVVSNAAGLLKEELDADIGGSGFSFSDLLVDRAGTTFAIRATRDEASARAMQNRIFEGFRVEEFFPPAADLPEGIPDAELQSHYGGVGGERYGRLIEEIERRIAACVAYR